MFTIKNVITFRIIVLIILSAFTGCVSSRVEYVEENALHKEKVYRISELYMYNGTKIDLKEKEAKFKLKYKGNENVIVYYEDVNIEKFVLLKDVDRLKIEVLESNVIATVIVGAVIVAASVILFFLLLLNSGSFKVG